MADQIIVMDQGRVAEIGSHHELLRRQGIYAELFTLQAENYRSHSQPPAAPATCAVPELGP
jgi:ABC-type transport system involved in cytochrome bd biosynthesis fused ATPase/permease subunit